MLEHKDASNNQNI
jgi:hypothetical protein